MMKNFTIPLLAAIIGSALTIAAFFIFDLDGQNRVVRIEHLTSQVPSQNSVYTVNEEGEIIPLDFTDVSKRLMGAVVHISSVVTMGQGSAGRQQLPDPFREFFGEEFFDRYNEQQRGRGETPRQSRGSGSGVIISPDGYIVTSNHVIANADEIEVTLNDNRSYIAKVLGTDPTTDLALVKIEETGLPIVPIVDSNTTEVGEWVLAIGNPFNLNSTVTAGIISAKSRNINILNEQYAIESFLQTDAAINPGNSGGALVNLQGGLIGINTAIASQTGTFAGYGFAVPSNIVSKVIEDILEFGRVQRGYLGVTIRNISGAFARQENLNVTQGVYIDSILAGSAAEKAGLQAGDVIVEIDGRTVNQASELQEVIASHRPGDRVKVEIIRNGRNMSRTATLLSSEGTTKAVKGEEGIMLQQLGAEMATLSREEARELGIPGGVKVLKLHSGKLATETPVKEGFIILRVNTRQVRSVSELTQILEKTSGGVMIEGIYESDPRTLLYYAFGM
jgi:serine protease Do